MSSIKSVLILILCFFFGVAIFGQTPCRIINIADYKRKLDSLKKEFGVNKIIQPEFETQILIALSYFSELKDLKIKFLNSKISTTMQCRPGFFSIFGAKSNREYFIFINNDTCFEGVLLRDAPFNAQIGIIGHELSHILDYENRNTWGIIQRGFDYFSDESKRKYECEIDSITIEKGLGWQLYDWAYFSVTNTCSNEKYKDFKLRTYMQPLSIEGYIRNRTSYYESLTMEREN